MKFSSCSFISSKYMKLVPFPIFNTQNTHSNNLCTGKRRNFNIPKRDLVLLLVLPSKCSIFFYILLLLYILFLQPSFFLPLSNLERKKQAQANLQIKNYNNIWLGNQISSTSFKAKNHGNGNEKLKDWILKVLTGGESVQRAKYIRQKPITMRQFTYCSIPRQWRQPNNALFNGQTAVEVWTEWLAHKAVEWLAQGAVESLVRTCFALQKQEEDVEGRKKKAQEQWTDLGFLTLKSLIASGYIWPKHNYFHASV